MVRKIQKNISVQECFMSFCVGLTNFKIIHKNRKQKWINKPEFENMERNLVQRIRNI